MLHLKSVQKIVSILHPESRSRLIVSKWVFLKKRLFLAVVHIGRRIIANNTKADNTGKFFIKNQLSYSNFYFWIIDLLIPGITEAF